MKIQRDLVLSLAKNINVVQLQNLVDVAKISHKDEITSGEALVIWVADLIKGIQICDSDQLLLLLKEFASDIVEYGDKLGISISDENEEQLPVACLVFGDRKYVSLTGAQYFLDLQSGKQHVCMKLQAMEMISYNLAALFTRKINSLRNMSNGPLGTTKN